MCDHLNDTNVELKSNGFTITLNNRVSYNTKPYDDYRVNAYDATGTAITLSSPDAITGTSPSTNIYFAGATGKYMNTWTHFAFSRSAADTYHLYQDGVLICDITTASTITHDDDTPIVIGGKIRTGAAGTQTGVLIDDYRFYNTAFADAATRLDEVVKMANTSLSTASGGICLKDLAPNEISVSKGQLVGVEVTETTSGANDTGCEKLQVQLVASA